jgi:hypothetical protein
MIAITFIGGAATSVIAAAAAADVPRPRPTLVVVVGAAGTDEYGKIFAAELDAWRSTADAADVVLRVVGDPNKNVEEATDKTQLQTILQEEQGTATPRLPLWLIFIGHGTFDGRTAAFNLRGPDLSAAECAEWLKAVRRPMAIIDTTAASAPFLTALSAPGRVVITATKSGQERNYARFGRFFARRIVDPSADLDKDEQTSLLEAFLAAARDTTEFYKQEGRIATEHPLLDDDGDGRGVRDDFFIQGRVAKATADGKTPDGALARTFCLHPSAAERKLSAEQTAKRDELEAELATLRRHKPDVGEEEYFSELERVLTALARLYADAQ